MTAVEAAGTPEPQPLTQPDEPRSARPPRDGKSELNALAQVLRADQATFLAQSGRPDLIDQPGGAYLPGAFPVPVPHPDDPAGGRSGGEPVVETFVVTAGGLATPTGSDAHVGAWWQPTVDALVARILAGMAEVGVELEFPGYLTASATPLDQVATSPHFDDDQPRPTEGVGLVIIAASHGGPRLLVEPMASPPVHPPVPLVPDPGAVARFDQPDARGILGTEADRIVVFPRFGQLHSGPRLDPDATSVGEVRNLLVFRAGTIPSG